MSQLNNTDFTYPYSKYIKAPEQIGSSPKPNALGKNVAVLGDYVQVLVSGESRAQNVSPLGNKYFMNTGGKCKDLNGTTQTRHVFINNIPDGTMPFISSGMGMRMTSFEGLVPGVLGNMTYMNPFKIFRAFDKETPCQKIKMPVRDINNVTGEDEKYVCNSDIAEYNPCWFSDKRNPITNQKCVEIVKQKNDDKKNDNKKDDNKKKDNKKKDNKKKDNKKKDNKKNDNKKNDNKKNDNKKNDNKNDNKKNDNKNDNKKNDNKNDNKKKKKGMTLQFSSLPDDFIFKTYEYGIYLLGVYLLYRLAVKR
jgi:hypothetical protein